MVNSGFRLKVRDDNTPPILHMEQRHSLGLVMTLEYVAYLASREPVSCGSVACLSVGFVLIFELNS